MVCSSLPHRGKYGVLYVHVCNCYRKSNREQRDVDSDREREQHVSDSDVGMKGNLGRWHVQRCLGLGLGLSMCVCIQ